MTEVKLTQFSHGGGCGCKIAPAVLDAILKTATEQPNYPNLLVGNSSKDDAAIYDLGNGTALISTTDFFMPIIDDPYQFGRIAAANAISDVYAMGGKPIMALAILGWPIDKLPATIAAEVIEGGRSKCLEAGIPLAGGHSIDTSEPIFGLSVNGLIATENIKQNNGAKAGDLLFLTKPLGVGILATAQKRGLLSEADLPLLINQLNQLNKVGQDLGLIKGVHAMTDVTGFGLIGHLMEMAEGSSLGASIQYCKVPILDIAKQLLAQKSTPDATFRNWNAYSAQVAFGKGVNVMEAFSILPDPQTNGGLLIAVDPSSAAAVQAILQQHGLQDFIEPIGYLTAMGEKRISIEQ